MTTPPQRPGDPGWRGRVPPPDPATQRFPRPARPQDAATEQLRAARPPAGTPPTERIRAQRPPTGTPPTERLRRQPPPPPRSLQPPPPPPRPAAVAVGAPEPAPEPKRRGSWRNRQSIVLICVIAVAVLAGGLASAELYARHRADGILSAVTQCVVDDGASISFGVNPPLLWQYATGRYTNISVTTAGNRVQSANGMTAEVTLSDVRLQDTSDSKGTIGELSATLTWKSAGIKDTVAANLPVVGKLITGVRTDPAAGTIVLEAGSNSVTAKPVVVDGDLNLEVVDVNVPLPKATIQGQLDTLTKKLNDNYPLGIHADSVDVTAAGVVGKFSSQHATIPRAEANPCFARL